MSSGLTFEEHGGDASVRAGTPLGARLVFCLLSERL